MALRLADGTSWSDTLARAVAGTAEAFDRPADGTITLRNLVGGEWRTGGAPTSARNNSVLVKLARLDARPPTTR